MNTTKLFCGLLLTATLGIGCKPRVRAISDAVVEKNPDGTTTVTNRRLGVALAAPEKTDTAASPSPNEMRVSWWTAGGFQYLSVKTPDKQTPMTPDDLKIDLELSGSSVRILETQDSDGGGFNVTFSYRNKKFEQIGGHYSVKAVGDKKIVCTYTSSYAPSVREAKSICDSIQPYEAPAVAAKTPSGKL
jgi:hypothetical protein